MTQDDDFTDAELEKVSEGIKFAIQRDRARHDAVMAEIAKDEKEARERLRQILIRKAICERVGYLK